MTIKNKKRVRYDGAAPLPIILYLLSVCTALMYTICRSQFLPCSLIMSALTAGIFVLFYKLRFRPIATSLCIFGFIIAAWITGSAAGAYYTEGSSFVMFLFNASAQFDIIYAAAAVFIFSLIIGFLGCYFSVMSPRPCFLMLLMFIPMILSSRTAREMPVYFMLIMTGCFIFASANLSIPYPAANEAIFEEKSSKRRRVGVTGIAAAVLTLIVAVLPKSTSTPLEDYLNSFLPQERGYFSSGLSNFASRSSVNTGDNNPDNELLFTVDTNSPGLLKCWAFDIYNADGSSSWTPYTSGDMEYYDFNIGYSNWKYDARNTAPAKYIWNLCNYNEGMSEESLALLDGITPNSPETAQTIISIKNGSSTRVVIHPSGETSVWLPEECGRSFRNHRGDIFTEFPFPVNSSYSITHYPNSQDPNLFRRLDNDSFEKLINDGYERRAIPEDSRDAILDEMDWAKRYQQLFAEDIPPAVQSLADEITEGLESDYDKARAIERWFGEAGFLYDLKFVPEKLGVEYFLFESRRGICSDFATAVTLLARAAGLPARYCEGYAITPETYDRETGLYNITSKQAHAYTEIYIPGGSWIDFDATRYVEEAPEDEGSVPWWLYVLAGTGVAAVLMFLLRKPLGWLLFNITYPMRSKAGKIRGVYSYTRRMAAAIAGSNENNLTCGEVQQILTNNLNMPQEAALICSAADKLFYSPEKTAEDNGLLKSLKALKKRRRRLK